MLRGAPQSRVSCSLGKVEENREMKLNVIEEFHASFYPGEIAATTR